MKNRSTCLFVVAWCVGQPALLAVPVQWTIGSGGNGHWYEAFASSVAGNKNWDEANAHAQAQTFLGAQGHLATITSAGEDAFVAALNGSSYLLGGFQPPGSPEPAGGWQWVTGEPWGYTNWDTDQPNNFYGLQGNPIPFGSPEEVLAFHNNPRWNDLPRLENSSSAFGGWIVEYDVVPEPSSLLLLLASGSAALAARRLRSPRQLW